jgi:DnaJ-domain-containing protein 1
LGAGGRQESSYDGDDPDMRAAYEELDAYLRGDTLDRPQAASAGSSRAQERTRGASAGQEKSRPGEPPEALRDDFAALGVPFGAELDGARGARSAYKALLQKYHPDRFEGDPEKQGLANDVTQRLNAAYRRIEAHYRRHRGPRS